MYGNLGYGGRTPRVYKPPCPARMRAMGRHLCHVLTHPDPMVSMEAHNLIHAAHNLDRASLAEVVRICNEAAGKQLIMPVVIPEG